MTADGNENMERMMADGTRHQKVVVLGAGLAGLGFAKAWGEGCCVFEAEGLTGGYARSHAFGGAWFDRGAHICHSRREEWLTRVLGHTPLHEMERSTVLNHKGGKWFSYPVQNHLAELPAAECAAALASFLEAQKMYAGREPRNYEEWCRFQYGDVLLENFYRLYTAKYWHTPMARLATDWLGGRLLPGQVENIVAGAKGRQEEKQAVFNRFRYPERGGFHALVAHLGEGADVRLGKRAVKVDTRAREVMFADGTREGFDTLVSTIPLPQLAGMVEDAPMAVRDAAAKLRAVRHYCVNFIVEREELSAANWFYVYDPEVAVSRVSFPFSLSGADGGGRTAVQAEIFMPGDARPEEEGLRDRALEDMGRILGFPRGAVAAAEVECMPVSYVISDLDRAAAVECIRGWLRERGVETAGLFGAWAYIWSDRAWESGWTLAERMATRS